MSRARFSRASAAPRSARWRSSAFQRPFPPNGLVRRPEESTRELELPTLRVNHLSVQPVQRQEERAERGSQDEQPENDADDVR